MQFKNKLAHSYVLKKWLMIGASILLLVTFNLLSLRLATILALVTGWFFLEYLPRTSKTIWDLFLSLVVTNVIYIASAYLIQKQICYQGIKLGICDISNFDHVMILEGVAVSGPLIVLLVAAVTKWFFSLTSRESH